MPGFFVHDGPPRRACGSSDLHHFEVELADTAFGAFPVVGYVIPFRAWRDALVWKTCCLVIDKAAYDAFPLFHYLPPAHGHGIRSLEGCIVARESSNKAMERIENFGAGPVRPEQRHQPDLYTGHLHSLL